MIRWYIAPLEQFDIGGRRLWHARTFRYAKPPYRCSNVPMQRGAQSTWWGVSRVDADESVHSLIDADTEIIALGRELSEGVSRDELTRLQAALQSRGVTLPQRAQATARDVVEAAIREATGTIRAPRWLMRY